MAVIHQGDITSPMEAARAAIVAEARAISSLINVAK